MLPLYNFRNLNDMKFIEVQHVHESMDIFTWGPLESCENRQKCLFKKLLYWWLTSGRLSPMVIASIVLQYCNSGTENAHRLMLPCSWVLSLFFSASPHCWCGHWLSFTFVWAPLLPFIYFFTDLTTWPSQDM